MDYKTKELNSYTYKYLPDTISEMTKEILEEAIGYDNWIIIKPSKKLWEHWKSNFHITQEPGMDEYYSAIVDNQEIYFYYTLLNGNPTLVIGDFEENKPFLDAIHYKGSTLICRRGLEKLLDPNWGET